MNNMPIRKWAPILLAAAVAFIIQPVRAGDEETAAAAASSLSRIDSSQWRLSNDALMEQDSAGNGPVAGHFDNYVLALTWLPAFCEQHPDLAECGFAFHSPDGFAAKHLILHGLWPNQSHDSQHSYGFCGVSPDIESLDQSHQWCQMPNPGLSQAALSGLAAVMPGANPQSCLEWHEWYRHGSCSGYSPEEFFNRAGALVRAVAQSNFGNFLAGHAGQTVELADLAKAFEADYGPGSAADVGFDCSRQGDGREILSEVNIGLASQLLAPEQLGKMLVPQPRGSCPADIFLVPAPSR
jgi:ribonuclease T2